MLVSEDARHGVLFCTGVPEADLWQSTDGGQTECP
jgi:hypothetical protein